jgi:hypothetical protein
VIYLFEIFGYGVFSVNSAPVIFRVAEEISFLLIPFENSFISKRPNKAREGNTRQLDTYCHIFTRLSLISNELSLE